MDSKVKKPRDLKNCVLLHHFRVCQMVILGWPSGAKFTVLDREELQRVEERTNISSTIVYRHDFNPPAVPPATSIWGAQAITRLANHQAADLFSFTEQAARARSARHRI